MRYNGNAVGNAIGKGRDISNKVYLFVVQRWLCRDCGYRFIEHSFTNHKNSVRHTADSQVCGEGISLAALESRMVEGQREATTDHKIILFNFAWWLKKEGYAEATIQTRTAKIRQFIKSGADIYNPESVKETIAKKVSWNEATKVTAVIAYNSFVEMNKLSWTPPRYKMPETLPFIPHEEELDALIHSAGKITACFLQGLKETGADPGELARIDWTDVDIEAKTVTLNRPVKGHSPRMLPISDTWIRMLSTLLRHGSRVFCTLRGMHSSFYVQRPRIAARLGNPRISKISFKTFRHWKGTFEYHRTKDILHVKQVLGHKNIQNTLVYINLEEALFRDKPDEYHVKVAETVKEACALVEAGFEYVTEMNGAKIFRKRKTEWFSENSDGSNKPNLSGDVTRQFSRTSPSFFVFSERLVATRHCVDRRFFYLILEDSSGHCHPQRVSKKEAFSE